MDLGLFVARVVFGLLMAAHGAQKLFGWFGGYGFAAVAGFFESLDSGPVDSSQRSPRFLSSPAGC